MRNKKVRIAKKDQKDLNVPRNEKCQMLTMCDCLRAIKPESSFKNSEWKDMLPRAGMLKGFWPTHWPRAYL